MKKIFSILLASIAMTSCVDTVILPDNKTVDEDFWQKKTEVDAVVATAYAQLRNETAMRNMIVWGDFRSDELVMTATLPASAPYKIPLSQIFSLNIETENVFTAWSPFYSAINYCNLVLEKAESVIAVDPDYSRGDYEANKAQMLGLRAYCYFYLMRVFHDIPVTPHAYLKSSDNLNAPQVAPAEIIDMCIRDLEEAAPLAVSGSIFGDWRDKGYMNRDAIYALLADIYLWRASVNRDAADYQKCVDYCDLVIKAKKEAYESNPRQHRWGADDTEKEYYLSPYNTMYADLFGEQGQNAEESIFELQSPSNTGADNAGLNRMYFRYNLGTNDGYGYLKASEPYSKVNSGGKTVWPHEFDQRMYEFVYDANAQNLDQFGVRKFVETMSAGSQVTTASTKKGDATRDTRTTFYQNWIFYRLTDVMLMKAEALVQLYELGGRAEDDTRNEDAFAICQFVNNRSLADANLADRTLKYTVYRDRMEELVLAERARELCFEGKRWFDLMRYNYRHTNQQADLTKKLTESYVANSDEFFELALRKYAAPAAMKAKMRDERYLYMPINQDEVEINTSLEQNPVYKSSSKY